MRKKWTKESTLNELNNWIQNDNWQGTNHFRHHNPKLYNAIYRYFGMKEAFELIGYDYDLFKLTKGKKSNTVDEKTALIQLKSLIENNNWSGIRDLQINNSPLYFALSRLGLEHSFNKIGLNYKDYGYIYMTDNRALHELKNIINNKEWKGIRHLKQHNTNLYNYIQRYIGFTDAFNLIGLDYKEYKLSNTWSKDTVLINLNKIIKNNEWEGFKHLQKQNPSLTKAINYYFGFEKAFKELGLNYNDFKMNKPRSKKDI